MTDEDNVELEKVSNVLEGGSCDVRCNDDDCTWEIESETILIDDPDFTRNMLSYHHEETGHDQFAVDARIHLRGFVDKEIEKTFTISLTE